MATSNNNGYTKFQCSLKPLTFCINFVGIPLNFSDKKPSRIVQVLVPLLGCFIIVANLIINGPRVFEPGILKWMEQIQNYNSSYTYFSYNPFGITRLVRIISNMIFFCYVPFLHLTFALTVLFGANWGELMFILQKIQQKMKLDEQFHRKLRRSCFSALILLVVVGYRFEQVGNLVEIHFLNIKYHQCMLFL